MITLTYPAKGGGWDSCKFSDLVHAERLLKAGIRTSVYFYFREEMIKKKITPHYSLALCLSQHWLSSRHPTVFLEKQQGSEVGDAILNGKEPLGFCRGFLKSCSFFPWFHSEWEFCVRDKRSFRRCCSELETVSYEGWGLCSVQCGLCHFSVLASFQHQLSHLFSNCHLTGVVLSTLRLYGAPLSAVGGQNIGIVS